MIENGLRRKWADGEAAVNGWLSIGNSFVAEVMAAQGFDSLTVDIQHGVVDYRDAVGMFQAMRASGVTPMARVPWLEPGIIMKALDAGAYGIICPMVNSREQAERLVSCMRYPPLGTRSFGPTRANFSAGANYAAEANGQILCIAMIETAEAMKNLDDIVATPGLDGVYIGPADLTLGITDGRLAPGFDREEQEIVDALKRILDVSKKAGIRAGLHCGTPEYAAKVAGWGFDLVTISSDTRLLAAAARTQLDRVRSLIGESRLAPTDEDTGGY